MELSNRTMDDGHFLQQIILSNNITDFCKIHLNSGNIFMASMQVIANVISCQCNIAGLTDEKF
jgi:hypothetical protein